MATPEVDSPDTFAVTRFIVGRCEPCDRDVLTYPAFDDEGAEFPHCVHCDAAVTAEVRDASGDDLPDHGYGLLELQGCGNPDCGGGRCSRPTEDA